MRLARRLLLAFWAGLLLTLGAVVAPALFAVLDDRHLAGTVAGALFGIATALSAAIAAALVALAPRAPAAPPGGRAAAVGPALLLAASHFGVRPLLDAARAAGAGGASAFAAWHALASALYWAAAVWVTVALVRELRT
ncbi:MAG TPA: DUF4149 domain-containing protein [Steroidobacteraceae bacterium]|nr:DUF4149 domain-containing protein [Steroidobacteraceae bacterium]